MDILKEISLIKENYESGSIDIVDGLSFSQYDTLRRIEFYTNSRYLNGNTDDRGRLKPFYNIINFRINVATRATDFDTKDFDVYTDNPKHYIKSMMFSKEMRAWMKRVNFAKTLNEFGVTRAKYGGVLIKRVKRNGELHIEIPQWKNLITDTVDIKKGVKAERHYMTPVQLETKLDVWDNLREEWDLVEKTFKKTYGKTWSSADRVCVLEVEGEFSNEYIGETGEGYSLQQHFVLLDEEDAPVACLHSEKKTTSDYRYLAWQERPGAALGIGVGEDGFEAQMAVNDSILKEQDIMEIAARTTFWTDSETIENNILSDVETGDILKVKRGETMQVLNTTPSSLPQLDNSRQKWDEQYSRTTSTFEAITGETMPSGTPFRAIAIQNQESTAMFAYRMEEAGIFWREVFKDWIIPHLKSKLTKEHILASDYSIEELMMIDEAFSTEAANRKVIERAIAGKVTNKEEYEQLLEAEKLLLKQNKTKRFIAIPKDYFKDLEAELDINITGEQLNKSVKFENINNLIMTISNTFNPQTGTFTALEDPTISGLLMEAVELMDLNFSPAMFARKAKEPEQVAPQPMPPIEEPVA